MIATEIIVSFYLMAGLLFFFWSQQFTPRSKQAFDMCFRYSRAMWVVGILIAAMLWPITALALAYRFTFGGKDADDEKSDR